MISGVSTVLQVRIGKLCSSRQWRTWVLFIGVLCGHLVSLTPLAYTLNENFAFMISFATTAIQIAKGSVISLIIPEAQ